MTSQNTNRILIISPEPTHPQNAGNRARIYSLLKNIKRLGYEVHFILFCLYHPTLHVSGKPDNKKMSATWHKFYYVPYLHQMPSHRLKKLTRIIYLMAEKKYPASFIQGVTSTIMFILLAKEIFIGKVSKFLFKNFPKLYFFLKPKYRIAKSMLSKEKSKTNDLLNENENNTFYNIDDWYNDGLDSFIQRLNEKYNYQAVIAEYVFLSKALLNFNTNALKIIDTHDIFTDRNQKYNDKGLRETFFSTNRAEEVKGLNRSDIILAIQDNEKRVLEDMTDRRVVTIGHKVKIVKPDKRIENRNNILYIGSGNIANIHGVNKFIQNVLPKIKANLSDVKLILAGGICGFIDNVHDCMKLGEIANLKDAYNMADVVINPNEVGTGLKIKNIEALGFSKPLVTTKHCAEGLNGNNEEFITADSDNQFADAIIKILTDKTLYTNMTEKAYGHAINYNKEIDVCITQLLED